MLNVPTYSNGKDKMKPLISKMFAAALFVSAPLAPAFAQQPAATVAVGMQVVDVKDAPVGTIISMNGDSVTLKTDRHEIPLNAGSFSVQEGKAYFGMTQAEVNAEYEKTLAAAEASLAPGAVVKGLNGQRLGTIESIDDQTLKLKLDGGQVVELPRSGIAGGPDGAVVGITAEDLAKQVGG